MDVRFVQIDQKMPVALGSCQQILDLLDKSLPALRVGPAEQLLGFLPRQLPAMQGGADRLAAAGPAEVLTHPTDQTPHGPARRWIGTAYRRRRDGALGGADDRAKAGLNVWAKGGRPPVRW